MHGNIVKKTASHKGKKDTKNIRLPAGFKGYFWDCDFKSLNMIEYRPFILKRLLAYGGRDAQVWVLGHFEQKEVREILKEKGARAIDRRSMLFWEKISRFHVLWR